MSHYDSIIIGAGHNGLVCAAYLAKAGQKVLVLESADTPGGLAASREFHAGFSAPVAHSVNHFQQKIASDLNLESHGLSLQPGPPRTIGLSPDGNHVVLCGDSVNGVDAGDADASLSDMLAPGHWTRVRNSAAEKIRRQPIKSPEGKTDIKSTSSLVLR